MDINEAFDTVHGNLSNMPVKYCQWKMVIDGCVRSKSLNDYRAQFSFMYLWDLQMRDNLAELRFVLDYHCSIFTLINPGLTFMNHHKLVIMQIVGAICEGLLYYLCDKKFSASQEANIFWKENKNRSSAGMGFFLEKTKNLRCLEDDDIEWLQHLRELRNTVHARGLSNAKIRWDENPIMAADVTETITHLDEFIEKVKGMAL